MPRKHGCKPTTQHLDDDIQGNIQIIDIDTNSKHNLQQIIISILCIYRNVVSLAFLQRISWLNYKSTARWELKSIPMTHIIRY